ncbi:MAG: hypothetical protein U9N58_08000, partial [Thermodesulfobacteriota bacterium]|nr:hypothetical protein [Thermodesulfobacteriota bacterium]
TLGTGGQDTVGYQIIRSTTVQKHEGQISNFYFLISPFRERLQHKKSRGGYNEHTSTARDNAKKANPYAAWHDKKGG